MKRNYGALHQGFRRLKQLRHHALVAIDDAHRTARWCLELSGMIDAESLAHRGHEIDARDAPVLDIASLPIGAADACPSLSPAPASTLVQARPMVAPSTLAHVRRAAEITHPDHQRRIEHAALFQVCDERCHRRIELVAKVADAPGVVAMRVPFAELDFYELDPMLDEPARSKQPWPNVLRP